MGQMPMQCQKILKFGQYPFEKDKFPQGVKIPNKGTY
jgi:hypothetical protein